VISDLRVAASPRHACDGSDAACAGLRASSLMHEDLLIG
jgi:hypothetical protein